MRASIVSFCLLILAACALLVYETPAGRALTPSAATAGNPAPPPVDVPGKSAPPPEPVPTPAPASAPASPAWELRFGEIASQPEGLQSQEELEALADGIADPQLCAALDELASDGSCASIIVARRLIERWVAESPSAAAAWVTHLSDHAFGLAMYRAIVVPWAQSDLPATRAWVQQQPDGGNKTAAELSLAQAAADGAAPVAAIELVADLPPGLERDHLLVYSARQWAGENRDEALAWISQIPDESLRGRILAGVIGDWAVASPSAAASLVADLPAGLEQAEALACVVRCWAISAPAQAAAWVGQFPEGELKRIASRSLLEVGEKAPPSP